MLHGRISTLRENLCAAHKFSGLEQQRAIADCVYELENYFLELGGDPYELWPHWARRHEPCAMDYAELILLRTEGRLAGKGLPSFTEVIIEGGRKQAKLISEDGRPRAIAWARSILETPLSSELISAMLEEQKTDDAEELMRTLAPMMDAQALLAAISPSEDRVNPINPEHARLLRAAYDSGWGIRPRKNPLFVAEIYPYPTV